MAEPFSCLLSHRQTDLSGSWKCWHLFGRLSDTSVPPSHFCKQMLMGFFLPLWHKYLDPWYLIQIPRRCDITSFKKVLESLRLRINKTALGYDCLCIEAGAFQCQLWVFIHKYIAWEWPTYGCVVTVQVHMPGQMLRDQQGGSGGTGARR